MLFDHLVGAAEHCGWHCKAKRFGRLEIDHQLVFVRGLHRQISGLFAFQDTIDVTGGRGESNILIGAIGNQAAYFHVPRRPLMPTERLSTNAWSLS